MAQEPQGENAPLDGNLDINFDNLVLKPFSLYVHVPYCSKRCGYCDFNTYTPNELNLKDQISEWANNALKEAKFARRTLKKDLELDTIFFGGGTPSLLDIKELKHFMSELSEIFSFSKSIEITLEANPDDITEEKVVGWINCGVNRISIGMQSSDQKILNILDRSHKIENVQKATEILNKNKLFNYSFDLIYGTPSESLDNWIKTLEKTVELNPKHISAYSLVIEPGTKMGRDLKQGSIKQVDEDLAAEKYLFADEFLSKNGFTWYEISNWSKESYECRHNLNYWLGNNWWGIGPGAHSHIEGIRWWNHKLPETWRKKLENENSPAKAREILTPNQIISEKIMLETRLKKGIDKSTLKSEIFEDLAREGLIDIGNKNLVLTRKGRLLADLVFRKLSI